MRPDNFVGRTRSAVRGALGVVTALAVLHAATPASALTSPEDPFSTWSLVSESTLKDSRGGFSIKTPIGTLEFDIAVTVNSAVKSATSNFSMQTMFKFIGSGKISDIQTTTNGSTNGANVSNSSKEFEVSVKNPGIDLAHKIAKDHVTSIAAVSESGVSVNHSTVMDIAVKNFSHISGAMKTKSIISNIARDVGIMTGR